MTMHERVSGVWKEITQPSEKVSGTYKNFLEGYERVSGVWKQFYVSAVVTVSGETIVANEPEEIGVRFNSDGTVDANFGATGGGYVQVDSATDWVIPNSAAPGDYEVMCTVDSGTIDTVASDAVDTWLPLTSTREWSKDTVGNASLTISVRKGSSGAAIDSGTYSLQIPSP